MNSRHQMYNGNRAACRNCMKIFAHLQKNLARPQLGGFMLFKDKLHLMCVACCTVLWCVVCIALYCIVLYCLVCYCVVWCCIVWRCVAFYRMVLFPALKCSLWLCRISPDPRPKIRYRRLRNTLLVHVVHELSFLYSMAPVNIIC